MKESFSKTEIESHSSQLTNLRIDKFLFGAGELTYSVLSNKPNPEMAMQLFGNVMAIFLQTHFVYAEENNKMIKKEIDDCIRDANIINSRFQIYGDYVIEEVINLNQLSLRAFYLMVQGLQNLRYFLRLGIAEPKGIDAALEIFNLDIWKKRESKKEREEREYTEKENVAAAV